MATARRKLLAAGHKLLLVSHFFLTFPNGGELVVVALKNAFARKVAGFRASFEPTVVIAFGLRPIDHGISFSAIAESAKQRWKSARKS